MGTQSSLSTTQSTTKAATTQSSLSTTQSTTKAATTQSSLSTTLSTTEAATTQSSLSTTLSTTEAAPTLGINNPDPTVPSWFLKSDLTSAPKKMTLKTGLAPTHTHSSAH